MKRWSSVDSSLTCLGHVVACSVLRTDSSSKYLLTNPRVRSMRTNLSLDSLRTNLVESLFGLMMYGSVVVAGQSNDVLVEP